MAKRAATRRSLLARMTTHPAGRFFLGFVVFTMMVCLLGFTYIYVKFARMIDEKLTEGPFPNTSMLFAAPRKVSRGEETSIAEIVTQLRRSGYGESNRNRMGYYTVKESEVSIFPGPDSYFEQEACLIRLAEGRVAQVVSLRDNTERGECQLEPELLTNLFDRKREKRRIVTFEDIPDVLVHAVISAEDKRFFQHAGFDPLRILKVVYIDLKEGRYAQGASTLSMQLARSLWLTQEKGWKRKLAETLITLQLEHRLTKQQIFEYYANEIDIGRRGSFAIRGFGEAAQAYFGKDIRQLTLAEAATLAGLIQRPSFTNPLRWPERARNRRNVVLTLMSENGFISESDFRLASESPLVVARGGGELSDAPYFVDLVNDELQERFSDHDFQEKIYRVYTTLDMDLQREASEAVRVGIQEVDEQLRRRRPKGATGPEPQVALVALDASTGEVKALLGGRNYGLSQLNRVLAKRQPGSAFKPLVYAAALSTSLDSKTPFTAVSTVIDEPTTFWYDNKPYEPGNYKDEFFGPVTLRQALAKSLNIPAVKLAEAVGYDNVVDLARRAGMNMDIRPTPAVALGAYDATPLEVAGAYTMFTNRGAYVQPTWIKHIRDDRGEGLYSSKPVRRQALDPRVSYVMVSLLEEVMRSGTAAGTRSRGFLLPAAGKTGTSDHDGWFAGFTTKLICVVWVGYDEGGRELKLEGARSALPIWTEFMKRAHQYREYRGVRPFDSPDGVITAEVDPASGQLATASCPNARSEVFVSGTQPVDLCRLHGGGRGGTYVAGWDSPAGDEVAVAAKGRTRPVRTLGVPPPPPLTAATKEAPKAENRGFFGRIRDIFR